ncbi:MAG: 16S rRNA (cytosine(967)-C(5))-methyltransferase RsmB, partial [Giesbergeria sp.]
MHGKTSSAQQPSANLQAPGGRTAAGAAPALSVVLQSVAACVQAVRAGRSGTTALETVPSALRPAVQALFFETLRHLGMAQALRRQLAPRTPAPAADALLCSALALMAPGASAAYE